MTGTTFAMSWCVSLRHCAVGGHDFRKTLTQIIKTRAKASFLCAKAVHPDQRFSLDELQLGAPAIYANCFGAFFQPSGLPIHGKSAKRCGQSGP
ncbi:hypothetical protein [Pseudomonas mandelii]|uniref:hypothetical protein n=1 Tax=Pseudomonas mandelii TaxID=75612 RepID=UPI0020A1F98C|nr:hypothetical protein [Pseudomonas mandelii]MCO8313505.1 hypothetical protein [Pseudomonas mandelii]